MTSQVICGSARPAQKKYRTPKRPLLVAAAIPATLWLVVFILIPGVIVALASVWTSDLYGLHPVWTLYQWRRALTTPLYLLLLVKTLRIAVVATAISLVIAYPVALYLSQLEAAARRLALVIVFIPFWVGFVVRTFAWLPILGREGLLNHALLSLGIVHTPIAAFLYNEGAVYLGLINGYLLFMILPIYLSLESIDPAVMEAAADLSAGSWARFRFVQLPLSMPGVLSGCVMVLLLNFGAYVTPALLGGPSGIMFSNAIAQQFVADNNWAFGSCLSLLMTAVALGGLAVMSGTSGMRRLLAAGEQP